MIIEWPAVPVSSFNWREESRQIVSSSIFGRQAIEANSPVWTVDMNGLPESREYSRRIAAFLDSIKGYQNQVALWNLEHPQPAGTMRGELILAQAAARGATTLVISGQPNGTLLGCDFIGIGSGITQQVLRVLQDATADANGLITVVVQTPVRNAFPANTAVAWDKPKALFRQKSLNNGIEFVPNFGNAFALSLVEDWRP